MNLLSDEHNPGMQKSVDYFPGALQQCLNDEYFTMADVNQGFLDMFGFSRKELSERFHGRFMEMLHPSDREIFRKEVCGRRRTDTKMVQNCRVQCRDGSFKWVMDSMQLVREESGEERLFSVLLDIDEERKQAEDLKRRAERDALTGLYNREVMTRKISSYLKGSPGTLSALFMIDTDNFKQVNDSQGHLFGDAVLSEMAAGMKRLARHTDVVGRIGGDEFAIFFKDIGSKEAAAKKAEELLDMFRHLFREERKVIAVTCSIGIALWPKDGTDFQSLYRSADIALYQAKKLGKNRYVLFEGKDANILSYPGYSSLGAAIDSDQGHDGNLNNLVSYVFHILYHTSDLDHAIQMILEIVGKRFDVSRAYIFENSEDGVFCDNTYEWCNTGISPQKQNLQHYPYDGLQGYMDLFHEDSFFYCRDVNTLLPAQAAMFKEQGVRATLQCAIREEERFTGFVGFDECTGLRMWTKEEIDMLSLISQLLTTFLIKKRVTDRDRQLVIRLRTILDTQDAYIYTIKKDTYELLYLNRRTRELDPDAKVGLTCHQAFFGREKPCENCPLAGKRTEIYNPKYGVWTKVRVAPMAWGEYDAYLLSCFDITKYKNRD